MLHHAVTKIPIRQRLIATVPAVQRGSNGTIAIVTEGFGRSSSYFEVKKIEAFKTTDSTALASNLAIPELLLKLLLSTASVV
jgi:hypothetical protein